MAVQAFALLCALGTLTCTASVRHYRQLWYLAAGLFAGVLLISPGRLALPLNPLLAIEPAQMSLLLFLLAFARIRGSMPVPLLLLAAGILSLVWLQTLSSLGYPEFLALPMVAGSILAAALGSLYRPRFCNAALLEEAFLIVMAYALVLAVVPEALQGWRSALGLKAVDVDASAVSVNTKVLWIAAGFVVLGGLYAKLKPRRKVRS